MAGRRPSRAQSGTLGALIESWRLSPAWTRLRPASRVRYHYLLDLIMGDRTEGRTLHNVDLRAIRRRHILELRDRHAHVPGTANGLVSLLSALFAFALDREMVEANPAARIERLKTGRHGAWPDDVLADFLARASEPMRRAALLAVETGQRRGDLLKLRWSQFDGANLSLTQEKTGVSVWVPASATLLAELAAWKADATSVTILANSRGRPWTGGGFGTAWADEMHRLGLDGKNLVFHGLRATLACRLAESGATTHEIASITGHQSLTMIERYTKDADTHRRASAAITKLDRAKVVKVSRKGLKS